MEDPIEVVVIRKDDIARIARYLKEERGFDALMDLTVVDYLGYRPEKKEARFEAVWYMQSFVSGKRVRLKAAVPDTSPVVPTLTGLFASADWLEREAWDMFGIGFEGHPGLKRILMYEEFSGHPLRKDYPLKEQQPRVEQVHPGVPPFGARPKALGGE
jgi:NADH-quinone oxidoreductase subunit C